MINFITTFVIMTFIALQKDQHSLLLTPLKGVYVFADFDHFISSLSGDIEINIDVDVSLTLTMALALAFTSK